MIEAFIVAAARVIEAIAASMIVLAVAGGVVDLIAAAAQRRLSERTTEARLRLAERLVLSIEFLIAADILKTVITPTLQGIGLLAGIIVIRTVLSLSIAFELRRGGPKARPASPGPPP